MANTLTLLDPIGEVHPQVVELAPRLNSIVGKRIGILYNNKRNRGDGFLDQIAQNLRAKGQVADVFVVTKLSRGRPVDQASIETLAGRSDGMISGVSD